jgi:Reverse transcriptase (RNA-dependent DNA polymerase)
VVKGYTQTQGIAYYETFTPGAKMNTVRIFFSIAVNKNWNLHQMDVKNDFFQGTLEEKVYMTLPPSHKRERNSNLVCRLKKAIYGLRQSSISWYGKLSHFLLSSGFKISGADSSVFVKHSCNGLTVVLVYVDDIIITGDNQFEIDCIKENFKQKFKIKDLGRLKYFLGIEIDRSSKGLFISQ